LILLGLPAHFLDLSFQLLLPLQQLLDFFHGVVGAAANQIADFPEPLLVAPNEIQGALAGEGFHASDAGGDAAFEMELENSDLAGTVDMGAAA